MKRRIFQLKYSPDDWSMENSEKLKTLYQKQQKNDEVIQVDPINFYLPILQDPRLIPPDHPKL